MASTVNKLISVLSISFIFLLNVKRISTNQNQALIPPDFDKICRLQDKTENTNPVKIVCDISVNDNQTWRLDTLREWINTSGNNQSNRFSYDITCSQSGGSVSIPWPMKCPRLVELTVRGCDITDIYSDFGSPIVASIPSQLTKLELIDSTLTMKLTRLLQMFGQIENITSEYDCLHDETLEINVFRNVSYHIDNDIGVELMTRCIANDQVGQDGNEPLQVPQNDSFGPTEPKDDIQCELFKMENILDLPKRMRNLKVSCNYKKLRHLDDSVSSTLSVYHHRFLTKYSKFPVLEVLNYSYNNIDVMPEELRDWSFYFSTLEHMDLSHNRINKLPKVKTPFTVKLIQDTYINLQWNNITTLTSDDLEILRSQQKTYIDIRHNPLNCDCGLEGFLVEISEPDTFTGHMQKYYYIKDMTCHLPVDLNGRTLRSLSVSDLGCTAKASIIPFVILGVTAMLCLTIVIVAVIYRREIKLIMVRVFLGSKKNSGDKKLPDYYKPCKDNTV